MIQTCKNQYLGVNPHLQSRLQAPEESERAALLHNMQFTSISHFLNQHLPTNFYAHTTDSLQRWQEVDFRILAVVVREKDNNREYVARIELIVPSSKQGRSGYESFQQKRRDELQKGVVLVELDYLHEMPSIVKYLPMYPRDNGSHAFCIMVSDPHPSIEQGKVMVYGFGVDDKIPVVTIPLNSHAVVEFDFGFVYQHTFRNRRWGTMLDYTQFPAHFETYRADDQARIQHRMALIAETHARGEDLEAD